jgi:hypothetical protein
MIWTFYVNIGIRLLLFLVEIVLRLLPVGWNRVRVLNDVFVSERGEGSELCPLLLEKGWLKTITKSGKRRADDPRNHLMIDIERHSETFRLAKMRRCRRWDRTTAALVYGNAITAFDRILIFMVTWID